MIYNIANEACNFSDAAKNAAHPLLLSGSYARFYSFGLLPDFGDQSYPLLHLAPVLQYSPAALPALLF